MSHRSQAELAQSLLLGGAAGHSRAQVSQHHRPHRVQLVQSAQALSGCGSSPAFFAHVSHPRRSAEEQMPLDELLKLAIGSVLTKSIGSCGCAQPCAHSHSS